jgi:hypothetical protein
MRVYGMGVDDFIREKGVAVVAVTTSQPSKL